MSPGHTINEVSYFLTVSTKLTFKYLIGKNILLEIEITEAKWGGGGGNKDRDVPFSGPQAVSSWGQALREGPRGQQEGAQGPEPSWWPSRPMVSLLRGK